jgi:hypothetical protein
MYGGISYDAAQHQCAGSQPVDTLSLERHRRLLIVIMVALLAIGAFLVWGPIGLGSGPLRMGNDGAGSGEVSSRTPVAIVDPIRNTGGSALVIDEIQLLGNGSYPAPHALAMEVITYTSCFGLLSTRTTAAGFVLTDGCGSRALGPLYGRAIGDENSADVMAAFEIRPPRPGACWLMTRIVARYHVGIRHYEVTEPYVMAACAGSAARAAQIARTASP